MKKIIYFFLVLSSTLQAQYITGGYPINTNQASYQASLQLYDSHICGCSVLNNQWLITAAHCVQNQALLNLKVKIGYTDLLSPSSNSATYSLNQIIVHPNYNSSNSDNDIALIKISGNINFNAETQPITLANPADNLTNIGQSTKVSGWGWTIPGVSSGTNQLMMVDVPIISNLNASSQLDGSAPGHSPLTSNMIATSSVSTNRQGACYGDSGGPLVVTTSTGIVKQIGTVSWGAPACVGGINSPSVYTKVENYIPWINQYIYPYKLKGAIPVCYQSAMSYVFLDPTPPAGSTITWASSPELSVLNSPISPTNSPQIFIKSNLANNNYNSSAYLLVTVNGVQQKLRVDLGSKPFSYNVINTPANISSDYCDASFHYTSIDVVNSDKEASYSYSFSMLSTATNTNPNLPITYTQVSGAETGTSRFLFKIPRSKISATGPALIYAITINSPCASSPMVSYNNAINIKPCYSGGTTYRMSKNKEESSFKKESSFEDNMVYSVYPNPTNNLLFINLGDQAPKELINSYAIMYDVLGVERKYISIESNMVYIDTSNLSKGIYILKVNLEGQIKTHKIVVE